MTYFYEMELVGKSLKVIEVFFQLTEGNIPYTVCVVGNSSFLLVLSWVMVSVDEDGVMRKSCKVCSLISLPIGNRKMSFFFCRVY